MTIVKCPYCNRRYGSVVEARDHIRERHPDGELG